jgi:hypothetical protein
LPPPRSLAEGEGARRRGQFVGQAEIAVAAGLGDHGAGRPDARPGHQPQVNAALETRHRPAQVADAGEAALQHVGGGRVAATLMKPASLTSSVCWGTLANMRCVWASIRPGMRVRPPPWIRVTLVPAGAAMGAVEIDRMVLPTTRTLAAGESRSDVPLKIRTFSNSTPDGGASLGTGCCLLPGEGAHEKEECAERTR